MPETVDRLALIKARHAEAGGGDADKGWLVAEVERLRREFSALGEFQRLVCQMLDVIEGS